MPPTSIENFNLPPTAPHFTEDRPLGSPSRFAIFHTAALSFSALHELETLINSRTPDLSTSKLAPTADFSNHSLRTIYDHFLTLRSSNPTIQPLYFIVADRSDFEQGGVLGVCLDCSQEGDCDVGVIRCSAEEADSYGGQLVEGMVGWDELKEYETALGDKYERLQSMGVDERHAYEAEKHGWVAGTYAVQTRDVYGWYSLVQKGEVMSSSV